jgi:hypothetical protein
MYSEDVYSVLKRHNVAKYTEFYLTAPNEVSGLPFLDCPGHGGRMD